MDGDPYARILGVIRGQGGEETEAAETRQAGRGAGPGRLRLGRVTAREPLQVLVAGVQQPASALRLNERLAKGARWKARVESPDSDCQQLTGELTGPVACPEGQGQLGAVTAGQLHSGSTDIRDAGVTQLEIDLEVGDQVLLLTEDDQIFYIIMKVVEAV